jgi:hypothetical protein
MPSSIRTRPCVQGLAYTGVLRRQPRVIICATCRDLDTVWQVVHPLLQPMVDPDTVPIHPESADQRTLPVNNAHLSCRVR